MSDLEEIRKIQNIVDHIGEGPITPEDQALLDKWAPVSVSATLLSMLDSAHAESAMLRSALESLRGELNKHDGKSHEPDGCWGCQLRLVYIDPVLSTPGSSRYAKAIQNAKEVLEECALPPYRDSDLASLIKTLNARASSALDELRAAGGDK